jgi:hypothetical protein
MQLHIQRILINIVHFEEVFTAVVKLRERGYSEAYLTTMITRAISIEQGCSKNASSFRLLFLDQCYLPILNVLPRMENQR